MTGGAGHFQWERTGAHRVKIENQKQKTNRREPFQVPSPPAQYCNKVRHKFVTIREGVLSRLASRSQRTKSNKGPVIAQRMQSATTTKTRRKICPWIFRAVQMDFSRTHERAEIHDRRANPREHSYALMTTECNCSTQTAE